MSKAYYFAQISRGVRIKIVPVPCVNSFVLKPTFHEENYICAHLWHLLYKKKCLGHLPSPAADPPAQHPRHPQAQPPQLHSPARQGALWRGSGGHSRGRSRTSL